MIHLMQHATRACRPAGAINGLVTMCYTHSAPMGLFILIFARFLQVLILFILTSKMFAHSRQMWFPKRIYEPEQTPVRLGNRTYRCV